MKNIQLATKEDMELASVLMDFTVIIVGCIIIFIVYIS